MEHFFDVIIIGGGVIGNAIARDLARFRIRVALVEKDPDVGLETSCRNSGVLHSGINYEPDTLRAKLSVRGNAMMDSICSELNVKINRIGKLTVAFNKKDISEIDRLMNQGLANGVPGLKVLNNQEMQKIQPNIQGIAALWSPTSAIISPYDLTISLAENAHKNGVEYFLNNEVSGIKIKKSGRFLIETSCGHNYTSNVLINASGLCADKISNMVGVYRSNSGKILKIWPCRGEYYVLDRRLSGSLKTLIYPAPGVKDAGLGIHLTPTVDGNILVGPSADYIPVEELEDYKVTSSVLEQLRTQGKKYLPNLQVSDFIRSFAGNRPKLSDSAEGGNKDFVIEEAQGVAGFINIVGIESPGLTSAPAIAELVVDLIKPRINLIKKDIFISAQKNYTGHFYELPTERQALLVKENPEYGEIVCRCEKITKKEVRDAIENTLGAKSLVSIKYRARCGMGRCQGGFCTTKIVKMLRDEYGYKPEDYFLRNKDSNLFLSSVRQGEKTDEMRN